MFTSPFTIPRRCGESLAKENRLSALKRDNLKLKLKKKKKKKTGQQLRHTYVADAHRAGPLICRGTATPRSGTCHTRTRTCHSPRRRHAPPTHVATRSGEVRVRVTPLAAARTSQVAGLPTGRQMLRIYANQ